MEALPSELNTLDIAVDQLKEAGERAKVNQCHISRLLGRALTLRSVIHACSSSQPKPPLRVLQQLSKIITDAVEFVEKFEDEQYTLISWSRNIDREIFFDFNLQLNRFHSLPIFPALTAVPEFTLIAENQQDSFCDNDSARKTILQNIALLTIEEVKNHTKSLAAPFPFKAVFHYDPPALDPVVSNVIRAIENGEELSNKLLATLPDFRCINPKQLHYRREERFRLGSGSFGLVYSGRLEPGSEEVAVKVLLDSSPANLKALRKEALTLQLLQHPHIIEFFGAQVDEAPFCLVMELAACSLYDSLFVLEAAHPLSLLTGANQGSNSTVVSVRKVQLLLDCCGALSYLHAAMVVHRDLKSMNVLLSRSGKVKISDFGLAKVKATSQASYNNHQANNTLNNSNSNALKGSPVYMPPELLVRSSDLFSDSSSISSRYSEASDMYAFGILMNEVLSHSKPYDGDDLFMFLSRMATDPEAYRPHLFGSTSTAIESSQQLRQSSGDGLILELQRLIQKAWNIQPTKRPSFASMTRRLETILAVLSQPSDSLSSSQGQVIEEEGIEEGAEGRVEESLRQTSNTNSVHEIIDKFVGDLSSNLLLNNLESVAPPSLAPSAAPKLQEDLDAIDRMVLFNFLRQDVQFTISNAQCYADTLIRNNVPNVHVLLRRLRRNEWYLQEIGFLEHDAMDLLEVVADQLLVMPTPPSSSKSSATRSPLPQPEVK